MNPIVWYIAAAGVLSSATLWLWWLNPPLFPTERNAPLEGDDEQPPR